MQEAQLQVDVIPVREDNFSFVLSRGKEAVIIDPGEAGPVSQFLDRNRFELRSIFITHYHQDHTAGVDALRSRSGLEVTGPCPAPFPVDREAIPGSEMTILGSRLHILDTPGHAFPHAAYYLPEPGWLFSGDCLFGCGCGRLGGDTAGIMWNSLQVLARLPGHTRVYFGHEYTADNLRFASSVEPGNRDIAARSNRVRELLDTGRPSVPSSISEELATNPFLRVASPEIRARLGMPEAADEKIFAALRRVKDAFR